MTGVQTCALPISLPPKQASTQDLRWPDPLWLCAHAAWDYQEQLSLATETAPDDALLSRLQSLRLCSPSPFVVKRPSKPIAVRRLLTVRLFRSFHSLS